MHFYKFVSIKEANHLELYVIFKYPPTYPKLIKLVCLFFLEIIEKMLSIFPLYHFLGLCYLIPSFKFVLFKLVLYYNQVIVLY